VSGIEGCIFVHASGFTGGKSSQAGGPRHVDWMLIGHRLVRQYDQGRRVEDGQGFGGSIRERGLQVVDNRKGEKQTISGRDEIPFHVHNDDTLVFTSHPPSRIISYRIITRIGGHQIRLQVFPESVLHLRSAALVDLPQSADNFRRIFVTKSREEKLWPRSDAGIGRARLPSPYMLFVLM